MAGRAGGGVRERLRAHSTSHSSPRPTPRHSTPPPPTSSPMRTGSGGTGAGAAQAATSARVGAAPAVSVCTATRPPPPAARPRASRAARLVNASCWGGGRGRGRREAAPATTRCPPPPVPCSPPGRGTPRRRRPRAARRGTRPGRRRWRRGRRAPVVEGGVARSLGARRATGVGVAAAGRPPPRRRPGRRRAGRPRGPCAVAGVDGGWPPRAPRNRPPPPPHLPFPHQQVHRHARHARDCGGARVQPVAGAGEQGDAARGTVGGQGGDEVDDRRLCRGLWIGGRPLRASAGLATPRQLGRPFSNPPLSHQRIVRRADRQVEMAQAAFVAGGGGGGGRPHEWGRRRAVAPSARRAQRHSPIRPSPRSRPPHATAMPVRGRILER